MAAWKAEEALLKRFTREARQVVVDAQEECRRLRDPGITAVHLLLALARDGCPLAGLLGQHGLSRPVIDDHAAVALRSHGIDVVAVRRAWGRRFIRGMARRSGCLPVHSDAKTCLELSLRESVRLRSGEIRAEHLLLGLLRAPGPMTGPILVAAGVDLPALQRDLELRLRPAT